MSAAEKDIPRIQSQGDTDDQFSKNIVPRYQSFGFADVQYADLIDRSVSLSVANINSFVAPEDRFESLRFSQKNRSVVTKIFDSPPPIVNKDETPIFFEKLQEWEGYVLSIGPEEFTARLVDLTRDKTSAEEEAEFLLEDLTKDDIALLAVGSIFRWIIGYQRYGGGPKQRVSQLVFRRIPAWTKRDFDHAKSAGEKLYESTEWE